MITWQRAEISARVLKEILMKWKWRLHGEGFSQGWKSYPGFWNRASIFSPSKRPGKIRKKSMYWKRNVSPGWKGNVSIRNEVVYFFQPCWNLSWNRNNNSGLPHRSEIRHFITLLSPHVRESGFRNPGILCLWNPESWALESGIQH